MKKIYCKYCKYCDYIDSYTQKRGCYHPKNMCNYVTPYEEISNPTRIDFCNKNNDCALFKERFWSKIGRWLFGE